MEPAYILLALFLLLVALKAIEVAWVVYDHRRFNKTLERLDKDNREVMDWLDQLKAERKK